MITNQFSGGIDSAVIAALADRIVPAGEQVDLINVAFAKTAQVIETLYYLQFRHQLSLNRTYVFASHCLRVKEYCTDQGTDHQFLAEGFLRGSSGPTNGVAGLERAASGESESEVEDGVRGRREGGVGEGEAEEDRQAALSARHRSGR